MNYPQNEDVKRLKDFVHSFDKVCEWMQYAAIDGKIDNAYRKRWITLIEQIKRTCDYAENVVTEQFGMTIRIHDPIKLIEQKSIFEEIRKILEKIL